MNKKFKMYGDTNDRYQFDDHDTNEEYDEDVEVMSKTKEKVKVYKGYDFNLENQEIAAQD